MFRPVLVLHLLASLTALAQAPGLSGRKVEFGRDVHPVLQARCGGCHSAAAKQGGLSVVTAESLKHVVVPGDSKASTLIARITGERGPRMPLGGAPLGERDIALIREWIDRGAPADGGVAASSWVAPLKPRKPAPPSAGHPVDAFVNAYWKKNAVTAPARTSDESFLRRAYLDLHGLPPTPEQRSRFLASGDRAALIDELLQDRGRYAQHWVSFWNDLLHNDEGVVYHGERKTISKWLVEALNSNMPFDRFVTKLIDPAEPGDPEGFVMGVNWRGDISASQTPAMQAAQNSAQVFMGVNIKCASCHDSFINRWKLKDAYGLASFFSKEPLELVRCDVKTGETASTQFLFPELGATPNGSGRALAAKMFTHPDNGRLARTFVNRMWTRLVGRGIVDNSDDMDAEPWSPDLLDWLASDFADGGYDVQRLLRRIMTSAVYQARTVPSQPGVFRGPEPRRLTAEQFTDAVSAITGQWRATLPSKPEPGELVRDWRLKASPLARALGRPVRDLAVTQRADEPSTLQALELVNGSTLAMMLERGGRYLAGDLRPPTVPLFDSGVVNNAPVTIDIEVTGMKELRLLIADHDTYDPARVVAGWLDATLEGPAGATKLDLQAPITPRNGEPRAALRAKLGQTVTIPLKGHTRFRATAAVDKSSLGSDINPRVRFLVYPAEPDAWRPLKVAGPAPAAMPEPGRSAESLVEYLFSYAFSRKPTQKEAALALGMVRSADGKLSSAGIADLLWILTLSPEFQFIS